MPEGRKKKRMVMGVDKRIGNQTFASGLFFDSGKPHSCMYSNVGMSNV